MTGTKAMRMRAIFQRWYLCEFSFLGISKDRQSFNSWHNKCMIFWQTTSEDCSTRCRRQRHCRSHKSRHPPPRNIRGNVHRVLRGCQESKEGVAAAPRIVFHLTEQKWPLSSSFPWSSPKYSIVNSSSSVVMCMSNCFLTDAKLSPNYKDNQKCKMIWKLVIYEILRLVE